MQIITLTGKIDTDGHLRLDVPTSFASGDVEVEITIHPIRTEQDSAATYDFSDLAGTLRWQGDPVVAQRNLRDEW
ncbi:MAG: hypothetical protein KME42_19445 [Tildeniella nuda ZEHNDER 1965/U140]|jgi:hypothetical protein|nr:hypothetical protein [Tildeniella nuda ZEHNDER 1965/U140]